MATEKPSYPKTLWVAGPRPHQPQHRIQIPGPDNREIINQIRFHDGSATVQNEHEEDTVRRALRGRVWESDLDEPEVDPQTAWVCYSSKAFMAYLKNRPPHGEN